MHIKKVSLILVNFTMCEKYRFVIITKAGYRTDRKIGEVQVHPKYGRKSMVWKKKWYNTGVLPVVLISVSLDNQVRRVLSCAILFEN